MDDENTMVFNWRCSFEDPLIPKELVERRDDDGPENIDAADNYRKRRNPDNYYLIDRQLQKTGNFTGSPDQHPGPRRAGKHGSDCGSEQGAPGPADRAIIVARQMLLDSIKDASEGRTPVGVDGYRHLYAYEAVLPSTTGD